MSWQLHAGCRGVGPEVFFPTAQTGPGRATAVAAAKAVCAGCPVRGRCLEFALEHLPHGIAGGLDEDERRAVRRSRAATARVARVAASTASATGAGS